jgi:hypothetical protein
MKYGMSYEVVMVMTLIFYSVRSWIRYYATSRKVDGSIPNEVIGILRLLSLSDHTVTLGSTEPLTQISTRCMCWE